MREVFYFFQVFKNDFKNQTYFVPFLFLQATAHQSLVCNTLFVQYSHSAIWQTTLWGGLGPRIEPSKGDLVEATWPLNHHTSPFKTYSFLDFLKKA